MIVKTALIKLIAAERGTQVDMLDFRVVYVLLLVLLTVPLAYKSVRGVVQFHSNTPKLIPTSAATIQLYLANALLLCVGYAVARVL